MGLGYAEIPSTIRHGTRYHVHDTPTYSSLLNQVERWLGIITQRAMPRGSSLYV